MGNEKLLDHIERFVDEQIADMDESGQWSTRAIIALLVLQGRIDEELRRLGSSGGLDE